MPSQLDDGSILLPENCNAAAAEQLLPLLRTAAPGRIDAGATESLGQAVLQLLLAARQDAESAGRPFEISPCSAAVAERIALCGLTGAFAIDQEGN